MHMKKIMFFPILVTLCVGCLTTNNIKVAGAYAYPESGVKKEVYDLILQLTSSNFFEYTQAARKLFEQKEKAVTLEMLYKYKHLSREVDGSRILVCSAIIKNILEDASDEWLQENTNNFIPELNTIVKEEITLRTKEK